MELACVQQENNKMSRIIVRNLPKTITEDKLRQIFGEKGTITDVQLKYTRDGKFRQFGFIGYHDEKEADEAVNFFNNTHVQSSKVFVERCALLGDDRKPKSWSKYAKDSTAYKINNPEPVIEKPVEKKKVKKVDKTKNLELLEKYKNDPEFAQYMNIHAPDDVENLLNNEEDESEESDSEVEDVVVSKNLAHTKISDADYLKSLITTSSTGKGEAPIMQKFKQKEKIKVDLFTVKVTNLPFEFKKKTIKDLFRNTSPYSIRIPRHIKGIAFVGFKSEKKMKQALLKDKTFVEGRRIWVTQYEQKKVEQEEVVDPKRTKWKTQEEALKNEEDIGESGKIFIRNLSYTTTEDEIQALFSKYGTVTEVNLPVDFTTRKMKGFGVITFLIPEQAALAYTELDGSILHGRMLHLLPGKAKDVDEEDKLDPKNFQKLKAQKLKAQAQIGHNWNALFVDLNAVADVVSKAYGKTKEEFLDDNSAAVRLALAETQIVMETKKYLESEGVNLDAFSETNPKRSKTIILVKNLPSNTEMNEVKEMFEKFGVINRLIFPPNKLTALVEFIEPSEARKAFLCLAYGKFKNGRMYLEWAPINCLGEKVNQEETEKPEAEESIVAEENGTEDEEEEPEPDTTLYVKNLNFRTTDDQLHNHFKSCGKLDYARVMTKKNPDDPSGKLSMGYGFVRFYRQAAVTKALKNLQASHLDGKMLELKRSERTLPNETVKLRKKTNSSKQTGTKILVRNLPFQASRKEVEELFRVFGELKSVRLPKKLSVGESSHRGFGFVDFVAATDAKKAFQALSQSTHLYDRRLVLEWAATEESITAIRKRTADHFHQEDVVMSKKSVFEMNKEKDPLE